MRNQVKSTFLVLLISGISSLFAFTVRHAGDRQQDEDSPWVGTWQLVEWSATDPDGNVSYPFSPEAKGRLTYGEDGRLSLHLMDPTAARFENEDLTQGKPDEIEQAWRKYFAYFGTYSVDRSRNVIKHQLEGCTFPNWVDTQQERNFQFVDESLVLSAKTASQRSHRLVWKRLK